MGNSPFTDVWFDLSSLRLADFTVQAKFSLLRVDIAANPARFTEVTVDLEDLRVHTPVHVHRVFCPG